MLLKVDFWEVLGKNCLCDQHSQKTLDTDTLMSSPDWQYFTRYHNWFLENEVRLFHYTKRTLRSLCAWFFLTLPMSLFSLLIFPWYPFTVINSGCAHNYTCWVYHALSEILNLRVILETRKTMLISTDLKLLLYAVFFKNQIGEKEL